MQLVRLGRGWLANLLMRVAIALLPRSESKPLVIPDAAPGTSSWLIGQLTAHDPLSKVCVLSECEAYLPAKEVTVGADLEGRTWLVVKS